MKNKFWKTLTLIDIFCVFFLIIGWISHWKYPASPSGNKYFEFRYFLLYVFWITPLIIAKWLLPNVSKKYVFISITLSTIIASGSWYFLSHEAYYNEQRREFSNQRNYFKNVLEAIDASEKNGTTIDENVLKAILHYNEQGNLVDKKGKVLTFSRKASIRVLKNDVEIFNLPSNREGQYKLEVSSNSKYNQEGDIIVQPTENDEIVIGDKYKLYYEYYNRPSIFVGLLRATTFSCFSPKYKNNSMQYTWLSSGNHWSNYISYYLYNRSTNFWLMFYACFFVAVAISYMLGEYEAEKNARLTEIKHASILKTKNDELDLVNKKLTRFKLMYQKMFREYKTYGIDDNKQVLQRMDFSWSHIVSEVLQSERHELKGRFPIVRSTLSTKEKIEYDKIIGSIKDEILNNLRRLPHVISYETNLEPVTEIPITINKELTSLYKAYKDAIKQFDFKIINSIAQDSTSFCDVNVYRLKSMVDNILTNASKQCARRHDELADDDIEYRGAFSLTYSIETIRDLHYLCISVRDNAGGIPSQIFDQIYEEPIPRYNSSIDSNPGEGTMYVAFFAKYMGIKIFKENWTEDNECGAKITLQIPIIKEAKNG